MLFFFHCFSFSCIFLLLSLQILGLKYQTIILHGRKVENNGSKYYCGFIGNEAKYFTYIVSSGVHNNPLKCVHVSVSLCVGVCL